MAQKIIYGKVNADRSIASGSGFRVGAKVETGIYTIMFDEEFNDVPSVTASSYKGGGPVIFQLINVQQGQFTGSLTNIYSEGFDFNFCFIAVGESSNS